MARVIPRSAKNAAALVRKAAQVATFSAVDFGRPRTGPIRAGPSLRDRCSSQTRSSSAAGVRCGVVNGLLERSARPASPSARHRRTHYGRSPAKCPSRQRHGRPDGLTRHVRPADASRRPSARQYGGTRRPPCGVFLESSTTPEVFAFDQDPRANNARDQYTWADMPRGAQGTARLAPRLRAGSGTPPPMRLHPRGGPTRALTYERSRARARAKAHEMADPPRSTCGCRGGSWCAGAPEEPWTRSRSTAAGPRMSPTTDQGCDSQMVSDWRITCTALAVISSSIGGGVSPGRAGVLLSSISCSRPAGVYMNSSFAA